MCSLLINLIQIKVGMQKKSKSVQEIGQIIITKKLRIIGISGVPGAGKSTIASKLKNRLPESVCVSMDGFHIYRKELSEEGIKRRGAPFTFDYEKFKVKMRQVYEKQETKFPTFNHEQKDPVEDAMTIPTNAPIILVEGLYIFDELLGLDDIWDMRIWIQIEEDEATRRVIERHIRTGVTKDRESAIERARGSDRDNGGYVLEKCRRKGLEYEIMENNKQSDDIK